MSFGRPQEAPKSDLVVKETELKWKPKTEIADADTYADESVVKEVNKEMNNLPEDQRSTTEQAKDVLKNQETKNKIDMLKEIGDAFEWNDKEKFSQYREEYSNITSKVMNLYNSTIESKINQENKSSDIEMNKKAEVNNGDAIDVDFLMNDTEASKEWADAILKQQPEKIENQGKLIREVLSNGTEEQKQVMYDIVNNMPEIVDLYNRINSDNQTSNVVDFRNQFNSAKKESSWDWNIEMAAAA